MYIFHQSHFWAITIYFSECPHPLFNSFLVVFLGGSHSFRKMKKGLNCALAPFQISLILPSSRLHNVTVDLAALAALAWQIRAALARNRGRQHLLQSSLHKVVAQVEVNIPGHFSSSWPGLVRLGCRLQRTHNVVCSDLRSTLTMAFTLLPEQEGKVGGGGVGGGAEGSEQEVGWGRDREQKKKQKTTWRHLFGIWTLLSCRCLFLMHVGGGNLIPIVNLLMIKQPSWWNLFPVQLGAGFNTSTQHYLCVHDT